MRYKYEGIFIIKALAYIGLPLFQIAAILKDCFGTSKIAQFHFSISENMRTTFCILGTVLLAILPLAIADCCTADIWDEDSLEWVCGDGKRDSTCCGNGKCNVFCCKCSGGEFYTDNVAAFRIHY